MTTPTHALLPCPFCGGKPFDEECYWPEHQGWNIGCVACEVAPIVSVSSGDSPCIEARAEAIAAWNTSPSPKPDAVEKIREALELLIREAQAVADDHHRPRYARLDEALASAKKALAILQPTTKGKDHE